MCIRDRLETTIQVPISISNANQRPIITPLGPLTVARGDVCLLYTSDAADERSSVDLGGRRIIKKKKRIMIGVSVMHKAKNKANHDSM